MRRRLRVGLLAILGLVLLVVLVLQFGLWLTFVDPGEYERATVTVLDRGGDRLGTVDVRIADTADKRAIGLSRTARLGADEGMFFVHEQAGRHQFVMRNMAFPLDIVFVAGNGTITEIHHADPAGSLTPAALMERYAGEGRYVLEVNRGWVNDTGVAVGDRLAGPEGVGPEPATEAADRPTVEAVDADGGTLGTVAVRIAEDPDARYTGLSETDDLGSAEGMLFVYETEGERAFVMRNMSFPLDMIFVDASGTVTTIHHADVPPAGADGNDLHRYTGRAKYVLEVNRGWANRTGLEVGDTVSVPEGD